MYLDILHEYEEFKQFLFYSCLTTDCSSVSETSYRGEITNVFAFASKIGIALGWGCLIVYTPELYPTVVRYVRTTAILLLLKMIMCCC